jgi:hypothetical protein
VFVLHVHPVTNYLITPRIYTIFFCDEIRRGEELPPPPTPFFFGKQEHFSSIVTGITNHVVGFAPKIFAGRDQVKKKSYAVLHAGHRYMSHPKFTICFTKAKSKEGEIVHCAHLYVSRVSGMP